MRFIPGVLKNLFGGPATRMYPFERRESFDKARGHVEMDMSACTFCGACAKRCPAAAITVDRQNRTYYFEPFRCIICEACVEVCPKKSITLYKDHRTAAYAKGTTVLHGEPVAPKVAAPAAE